MSILNLSAVVMTAGLFMAAAAFAQTVWHDGSAHKKVVESRCFAHSMPSQAVYLSAVIPGSMRGQPGSVAPRSF
jgi:hypothetical protein